MILVNGSRLENTIFPDGTSQVWKLPPDTVESSDLQVEWRFEDEREILDLLSLRELCRSQRLTLYIPYLPYARQDKDPSNDSTFNLHMFARLINSMLPTMVETIDVHSSVAKKLIPSLVSIKVNHLWKKAYDDAKADTLVFPDEGAYERYYHAGNMPAEFFPDDILVLEKDRDQASGKILGHQICFTAGNPNLGKHFFIVDDLCDGGATFISAAKLIRQKFGKEVKVSLWTTHGIYSRGRPYLFDNGIDMLYTTDSILKNDHHKGVTRV